MDFYAAGDPVLSDMEGAEQDSLHIHEDDSEVRTARPPARTVEVVARARVQ